MAIGMNEITDGTSNTIMFSERNIGSTTLISRRVRDTFVSMAWTAAAGITPDPTANSSRPLDPARCLDFIGFHGEYMNPIPTGSGIAANNTSGLHWAQGGNPTIMSFNTIMPPNGPSCTSQRHVVFAPTSNHPGGVNAVFGDGSVRFISELIHTGDLSLPPVRSGPSPYGVWGALGSAAGGEVSSL